MAESQLTSIVDTLFRDVDQFVSTKTTVGRPVQAEDTVIVPLVNVAYDMATRSFIEGARQRHRDGGDMSIKASPGAVLAIQGGVTKLVNVKNQDTIIKVIDMAPDFISKFLEGKPTVSEEMVRIAKDTVAVYDTGKAEHIGVK